MGFPILVKAVMGGGGKGMKLAMAAGELRVRAFSVLYVIQRAGEVCVPQNSGLHGR